MNTLVRFVKIGLMVSSSLLGAVIAHGKLEVTASVQVHARADFDAPLATHGTWVDVHSYGRGWRPTGVSLRWQPYCDGSWVWTDCGWYWQSDEPWAWACYHYGTWVYDSDLGWIWLPDIEWAPAWVYWRVGGGFVGWAPCPPRGVIVAPRLFAFVEVTRFNERVRPSAVIVNDAKIINKTTQFTEVRRETRNIGGSRQRVVINEGPGGEMIQKATGKRIGVVPIQEAARRTPVPHEIRGAGQPGDNEPTKPELRRGLTTSEAPSSKPQVPPDGQGKGGEKGKHEGRNKGKP